MKVRLTIKRSDGTFAELCYSGVKAVSKEGNHYRLDLYQDYKRPETKLLQEFNVSCTPFVHSFYDVESLCVQQEDRNQSQFQEDGEDLEDPVGYL
jgi:hypothetical protein